MNGSCLLGYPRGGPPFGAHQQTTASSVTASPVWPSTSHARRLFSKASCPTVVDTVVAHLKGQFQSKAIQRARLALSRLPATRASGPRPPQIGLLRQIVFGFFKGQIT